MATAFAMDSRLLAATLRSIPDYVYAFDRERRFVYANAAMLRLFGMTAEQFLGKNFAELNYPAELDEKLSADMDRVFRTGEPLHDEVFYRSPTGLSAYFDYVWGPVKGEDGSVELVVGVSRDTTERLRLHEQLQERVQPTSEVLGSTQSTLEELLGYLISMQEEERRRLARDLHDDLGQRAALIGLRLGELARNSPPEVQQKVAAIQAEVSEMSSRLRVVSHELHPSTLEDLGLEHAVDAMVRERRRAGAEVSCAVRNLPEKIRPQVATAVYRIAQEAVTNAVKHAEGSVVLVDLSCDDGVLQLRVEDNGPGFEVTTPQSKRSLGLMSMNERARLVGGTLQVSSRPGDGTVVLARVPLRKVG